jgi:tight adherence protein B
VRDGVLIVASLAVFAALEALFYGFHHIADRRTAELRRRLQAVGKASGLGSDLLRRTRLATDPRVANVVRAMPFAARMETLLEQADSSWTVAKLFGIVIASGLGAGLVGMLLNLGPLVIALIPLGAVLPPVLLRLAAERRSRLLSEQLPDALDTMSRSLRAGHSISAAFQVVASEMPPPIAMEFARAYEEQRVGLSLEQAVQQMTTRAPQNGDLQIFAVSTVIQRETGGNLAEILGNIANTIRQRFKFKGKLRALTAEGRASALVLGLLPIGVALLVSILNPGYLRPLVATHQGRFIFAYAVTSWIVGLLWLKKMSNLEY